MMGVEDTVDDVDVDVEMSEVQPWEESKALLADTEAQDGADNSQDEEGATSVGRHHHRPKKYRDADDEFAWQAKGGRYEKLRWRSWSLTLKIFIPLIIAVVLVVAAALFAYPRLFPRRSMLSISSPDTRVENFRRSPDDYILSPDWDFNEPPTIRQYHFNISHGYINPDGVYRSMLLVNGQFPGPMIECNEGDIVQVTVENHAVNATSIHWHGLFQNGSNWMDGTVGISQCPIAAGWKFTYEFNVTGQHGTYWYHAHQGVQTSDGLYGPFIIHSKEEQDFQQLAYSSDRVIMLQDHYYEQPSSLLVQYMAPDMENEEPIPDGALINGQAVRDCSISPQYECDNSTADMAVFNLAPNESHRLRFINVGSFAAFQVDLDEHELALTEIDGTDVLPERMHWLKLLPAQRYSVVVGADSTTSKSFWLRATMLQWCFADKKPELVHQTRAIMQYSQDQTLKSVSLPTSSDWPGAPDNNCKDMDLSAVVPSSPERPPNSADQLIYLRSNFEIGAYRLSRGSFNHSSYKPNIYSPSLHRTIDGLNSHNATFLHTLPTNDNDAAQRARRRSLKHVDAFARNLDDYFSNDRNDVLDEELRRRSQSSSPLDLGVEEKRDPADIDAVSSRQPDVSADIRHALTSAHVNTAAFNPSTELTLQTPPSSPITIDILIDNFDDGTHPIHLHGYKFWILDSGRGYLNRSTYDSKYQHLNEPSSPGAKLPPPPLRRDVTGLSTYEWILLRVTLDNPGLWAFHCHVGWHTEAGMLMQFLVMSDAIAEWKIPHANRELCQMEGLEKGAGVMDDGMYKEWLTGHG